MIVARSSPEKITAHKGVVLPGPPGTVGGEQRTLEQLLRLMAVTGARGTSTHAPSASQPIRRPGNRPPLHLLPALRPGT